MNNTADDIEQKFNKYKIQYSNKPCLILIKTGFFIFQQLVRMFFQKLYFSASSFSKNSSGKLNILFSLKGGLGDCLIAANFIYYFSDYINSDSILIDVHYKNKETLRAIFNDNNIINKFTAPQRNKNYDLIIELMRFPKIIYINKNKITKMSPKLSKISDYWQKFQQEQYLLFYDYADVLQNTYTMALGKKRIQQADIGNFFNIKEDFLLPVKSDLDKNTVLKKFDLPDKNFITINRSTDGACGLNESTKLWAYENYNKLIDLLKQEYPNIVLVQLGISDNAGKQLNNTDKNLTGKTSLEELKILLQNAYLHIDSEGGLVHLRKALTSKPSVVIFQSTSKEFYGYSQNINIQAGSCKIPCEHILKDWKTKCLKGLQPCNCSLDVKPEFVMMKIKEYINENKLY